jgi:hypothetical protein
MGWDGMDGFERVERAHGGALRNIVLLKHVDHTHLPHHPRAKMGWIACGVGPMMGEGKFEWQRTKDAPTMAIGMDKHTGPSAAVSAPTNLPIVVMGVQSPYPTVVTVMMVHLPTRWGEISWLARQWTRWR